MGPVRSDAPAELWDQVGMHASVSKEEYNRYFGGRALAPRICIRNVAETSRADLRPDQPHADHRQPVAVEIAGVAHRHAGDLAVMHGAAERLPAERQIRA